MSLDVPLLWNGPFKSALNYGEDARTLLLALERSGREVAIENWPTAQDGVKLISTYSLVSKKAALRQPTEPYVTVLNRPAPATIGEVLSGVGPTVIRTFFEGDSIPPYWLPALIRANEVWVPSRFNYKTFLHGGVPEEKLHILPPTLDFTLFNPETTQPFPRPHGAREFCFLSVLEFTKQKGWDVLLDAWCKAFAPEENVCLIIKATRHYSSSQRIEAELKEFLALHSHAPVIYDNRVLPQSHMPGLYKMCDAFVSPSRGEGWGRAIMEAQAMELTVIASCWGGNLDFTNRENSFLIDGELQPVPLTESAKQFRGMRWFEPNCEHLVSLLREVYNKEVSFLKNQQKETAKRLQEKFSEGRTAALVLRLTNSALNNWRAN